MKREIGIAVRRLRVQRGLSQTQLADLVQGDKRKVSRLELGECEPTLSTLQDYAEALGVSLAFLIAEAEMGRTGRVRLLREQYGISDATARRWLAGDTDAAIGRHTELVAERAACQANGVGAHTRYSRRYRGLSGGAVTSPLRCA